MNNTIPTEYTYQDLKRDVLIQARGMEPGKYYGTDGTLLEVRKLCDHYMIRLHLPYRSWTFFYPANQFEQQEAIA